jgi:hypothetical protein
MEVQAERQLHAAALNGKSSNTIGSTNITASPA